MKKTLLAAVVFTLLYSCDLFTNGGPCTYEDMPFTATVVSISKEKVPSPYGYNREQREMGYEVKVTTDIPGQDTLTLDDMVKQTITDEFLQEHQIKVGKVLKGEATVRTSGTCSPGGYRFADSTLNPY